MQQEETMHADESKYRNEQRDIKTCKRHFMEIESFLSLCWKAVMNRDIHKKVSFRVEVEPRQEILSLHMSLEI